MQVELKYKWKYPLTYFLQFKSSAMKQAGRIIIDITIAKDIGVQVQGKTRDGVIIKLSAMTHLECQNLINSITFNFIKLNFVLDRKKKKFLIFKNPI